jgi:hypothetical protein
MLAAVEQNINEARIAFENFFAYDRLVSIPFVKSSLLTREWMQREREEKEKEKVASPDA